MKLYGILTVIFCLSLLCGAGNAPGTETGPEAGKIAPSFTLKDVGGKDVSLSFYRGKVVLLNFWATWCPSCKDEMVPFNNMYAALKDKGFVVLAVSVDPSLRPLKSFASEKGLAFPVLWDKDKEVYFDLYAVLGLPITFLIDRNGVITEKIIGDRDWSSPEMKNKIQSLINRK
ncbi:MAG: redoxin domain-containing protein [Nitrospiraceae bacterium]|nr:redoxin domain-containing protein [Nitrospiraceae bacterium]